jgi:hypothetical protein
LVTSVLSCRVMTVGAGVRGGRTNAQGRSRGIEWRPAPRQPATVARGGPLAVQVQPAARLRRAARGDARHHAAGQPRPRQRRAWRPFRDLQHPRQARGSDCVHDGPAFARQEDSEHADRWQYAVPTVPELVASPDRRCRSPAATSAGWKRTSSARFERVVRLNRGCTIRQSPRLVPVATHIVAGDHHRLLDPHVRGLLAKGIDVPKMLDRLQVVA